MDQSEIRYRVEVALASGIENDVFYPLQQQLPDIPNELFRISFQYVQINAAYRMLALPAEKNGDARFRNG
jgi:hypothetical protein